jgi:hypothetical protein
MYRGSGDLLQRSVRHLVPVVGALAEAPESIWRMDADRYDAAAVDQLLGTADRIRAALPNGGSDTLVTKIMLGAFGCIPAFDTYFKRGLGVWAFDKSSVARVGAFYHDNAATIDRNRVETLDFDTGTPTSRRYTRAKAIDMVFFVAGGSATP